MKGNPASPGGSLASKPTWSNTAGCSTTSAFLRCDRKLHWYSRSDRNETRLSVAGHAVARDLPGLGRAGIRAEGDDPFGRHAATQLGDDEKAIADLVAAFAKAFNAGDAAAAAATYAEDALVVDEHGERTEGRAAIRAQLAASFADSPGSTIAIKVDSLRFLGPDTALEEGRTTITPAGPGGVPEMTRFTVVYIKKNGQWLQSAVRDELAHDLTPHDRLKELEWLVGDWINESQDAVVNTTCKWTDDGNFLVREFTMKTQGQPVLSRHAADRLGPGEAPVQDLDLRLRGRLRRGVLDPRRRPVADQGGGRATGRPTRVGHEYHHPSGQGPDELAIGRPHPRRCRGRRGSTSSPWCASHPSPASKIMSFLSEHLLLFFQDTLHDAHTLETGPRHRSGDPRQPA